MVEKQRNERKATRFDGVYQRPSRTKKYEGKPDVTYSIGYYDPHSGKRIRKTIGSRSGGITAEYANSVRQSLISTAKKEAFEGIVPHEVKHIPLLSRHGLDTDPTGWKRPGRVGCIRTLAAISSI